MKTKLLLLFVLITLSTSCIWADIVINEANFPDEKFRNFLLNKSYGSDGVLTDSEISNITRIDCSGLNISSLQGIEYFSALKDLLCLNCSLSSVDVSKNVALTTLECQRNQLVSLNVSGCIALTDLRCFSNKLTSIDVSKNKKLISLECYNNELSVIDISNNTELFSLYCEKNMLTSLDVSKNTKMEVLSCGMNQLTSLDVSKNTGLKYLYCYDNQLTSLDVSYNTKMMYFECNHNLLTTLDVSKCTKLTRLNCYHNKINGDGATAFLEKLPQIYKGDIRFIYSEGEMNELTSKQVEDANSKGWGVLYYDGSFWKKYSGTTAVEHIPAVSTYNNRAWYDLNGCIINSKPSMGGVYLKNGKKIIIQ